MKNFVLATVFSLSALFSTSAFAAFDPAAHTCADMQAHLARHGQISIQRLFGTATYSAQPQCRGTQEVREHYEWAKDTSSCQLGWECITIGG